jgi:hypothetical protein
MVFFHIVDDYYLQGWLASAKQKKYWEENAPQSMYKYDYIWALFMHSFSWAFMIMLPIAYTMSFSINPMFLIVFGINFTIHAIVDDMKANRKLINLLIDQSIHMIQIIMTAATFLLG